jgi:predicted transcriptional regulator
MEESVPIFEDLKESLTYTQTAGISGVPENLLSRVDTAGRLSKRGSA